MKLCTRMAVVMLAGLFATTGLPARSGGSGSGGGHGGSGGHGGHGGFSSGHSSGSSSGKGVGHTVGHSFARLFGLHGKAPSPAPGTPPLAGASILPAKVVPPLGPHLVYPPTWRRLHHHPTNHFPFGDRFLFFPPRPGFGFGGCTRFGFPPYPFFFDDEFNCFSGGFFFDPFFIGGFSGSFVGSPQNDATNNAASTENAKSEPPVTLLQLRDGSMYGLVDYWVEDGELHYTTTYGGQNSVELNRIDLEKTVQLNADRGLQFVLRPKTPRR